jgi:hypothetical protein
MNNKNIQFKELVTSTSQQPAKSKLSLDELSQIKGGRGVYRHRTGEWIWIS